MISYPTKFSKALRQFIALVAAFSCLSEIYAQECMYPENRHFLENRDPYTGYQPIGYKGSMERDEVWFKHVKAVNSGGVTIGYRFKKQRPQDQSVYSSIEPVFLGGKTNGFAAYRDGCGVLLNSNGLEFGLPKFVAIEQDYVSEGQGQNVIRLKLIGLASGGWKFALFKNGKLNALSRNDYLDSSIANALNDKHQLPRGYQGVSTKKSSGWGVVKLDTLDEIIEPRWQGVGGLTVYKDTHWKDIRAKYLMAKDEQGLHLFSTKGDAIRLPPFDDIKAEYYWVPTCYIGPGTWVETVITTTNKENATCRIYSVNMTPLFNVDINVDRTTRECPRPKATVTFSFTNSLGRTQTYDIKPDGQLFIRAENADELVYQFGTGVMVFRKVTSEGTLYWVAGPDGARLNDLVFTELTPLGCDFVRVKHNNDWVMLRPDGQIEKNLQVPFSC